MWTRKRSLFYGNRSSTMTSRVYMDGLIDRYFLSCPGGRRAVQRQLPTMHHSCRRPLEPAGRSSLCCQKCSFSHTYTNVWEDYVHLFQPLASFGKINLGGWIYDELLSKAACGAWTLTWCGCFCKDVQFARWRGQRGFMESEGRISWATSGGGPPCPSP